jgi:uncharacterized membrane protein YdjX (TVP38/TMEM64 family)
VNPRWRGLLAGLAVIGVLLLVGSQVRSALGIELSVESIRSWVASFGWKGPAVYLGIVTFRHFLFLPASVVLSVSGLAFGAGLGTLLGGLGITLSAFLAFGVSRSVSGAWILPRLGPEVHRVLARVERAGAWLVGLGTAHPMAPLTPFHCAAGLSTLSVLAFASAVIPGSLFRAGALACFGATLGDPGTPSFYLASGFLLLIGALPLAHRGVRERLFGDTFSGRP